MRSWRCTARRKSNKASYSRFGAIVRYKGETPTPSTPPKKKPVLGGAKPGSLMRQGVTWQTEEAVKLRVQGYSYAQIAEVMQVDPSTASKWVKDGLAASKAATEELASEVLQLELDRLDVMLKLCMQAIAEGDTGAVEKALKIQARRTAYLGLDAAPKAAREDRPVDTVFVDTIDFVPSIGPKKESE